MLDLKIKGRKAIVCAASKGLGRACAMSLGRAGVDLVITARTKETLEATAEEIRKETGAKVTAVAGDIGTEEGRQAALAACPNPDILVNNCGGPPHGDFRDWSVEDWQKAVNNNMLTPIMLIKAVVDGMCERKFGRIVNITSGSVKSPIPNLGMSNGARAGLTAFCAGLARQVAKYNVTINGVLPGPFLTDRLKSGIDFEAQRQNISFEEQLAKRGSTNPGRPRRRPGRIRRRLRVSVRRLVGLYRRPEPAARRRRLQLDDGVRIPLATRKSAGLGGNDAISDRRGDLADAAARGRRGGGELNPAAVIYTLPDQIPWKSQPQRRRQRGAVRRPVETGPLHSARALACRAYEPPAFPSERPVYHRHFRHVVGRQRHQIRPRRDGADAGGQLCDPFRQAGALRRRQGRRLRPPDRRRRTRHRNPG